MNQSDRPSHRGFDILKRCFDFLITFIAFLIILLPIALVALVVKLTSPGKVFFLQDRIGRNRKPFKMIKFRTMVTDAQKIGPSVTSKDDNRITGIGRILRRTKLDELPELWNVLVGDMSLVGPRPEVKNYVDFYRPEWERVFDVRPGITDLATLQFRDEESVLAGAKDREAAYIQIVVPIKMKLALEYVDRRSIGLDLAILFRTVWGITLGRILMKPNDDLAEAARKQVEEMKS